MDKEFVCYHITTKDRLPSILKEGLKPNSKPNWFKSKTPYIMLSRYPYWWLYQNREGWGLSPVDENHIILLEIKHPDIKRKYFDDPEGLRWGEIIEPKYINAIIDFKVNAEFEALRGRGKGLEDKMPLIRREVAENAVPPTDCSGRKYTPIEWEDNVRYVLWGAEIQRDKDYYGEPLIKIPAPASKG